LTSDGRRPAPDIQDTPTTQDTGAVATPDTPAAAAPDGDPDIALIRAACAAYAHGDIDQVVAGLHPQVEWIEPEEFPGGGRRVGPGSVAEYLRASWSSWAELHSSATVCRQGDTVVARHHVHGCLADGTPHDATAPTCSRSAMARLSACRPTPTRRRLAQTRTPQRTHHGCAPTNRRAPWPGRS
jgi:ketosteroid isomerase-like protein